MFRNRRVPIAVSWNFARLRRCLRKRYLAEIVAATGWQNHTVRGFVSILGSKGGEKIESSKNAARALAGWALLGIGWWESEESGARSLTR